MSVGNTDVAMELLSTAVVVGIALLIAAAVLTWSLRRRAAFRSTMTQRGWQLSKHDEATTVIPATGDWTATMTHS